MGDDVLRGVAAAVVSNYDFALDAIQVQCGYGRKSASQKLRAVPGCYDNAGVHAQALASNQALGVAASARNACRIHGTCGAWCFLRCSLALENVRHPNREAVYR